MLNQSVKGICGRELHLTCDGVGIGTIVSGSGDWGSYIGDGVGML